MLVEEVARLKLLWGYPLKRDIYSVTSGTSDLHRDLHKPNPTDGFLPDFSIGLMESVLFSHVLFFYD